MTALRHEKELRDTQIKAEADFKRAQVGAEYVFDNENKVDHLSIGVRKRQACCKSTL